MIEKVCKNCGYRFAAQGLLGDDKEYCGGCYPRVFETFCDILKQVKHPLYMRLLKGKSEINAGGTSALKRAYTDRADKIIREDIMPVRAKTHNGGALNDV